MSASLTLGFALALATGAALGVLHVGGLWLTLRRLHVARHPALLTLASFIGRTVVVAAGFYLLMAGSAPRLLFALLGFVVARTLLVRRLGSLGPAAARSPGPAHGRMGARDPGGAPWS